MVRMYQVWCRWEFVRKHSKDPDLYWSAAGSFTVSARALKHEIRANRGHPPEVRGKVTLTRYGSPGWFRIT